MTLYKYRSLDRLDRVADILVMERLYCAEWLELNDPMEGYFHLGVSLGFREPAPKDLKMTALIPQCLFDRDAYSETRICSLSASCADIAMWAHYGGSQKGVVIEIDLASRKAELLEVEYVDDLVTVEDAEKGVPLKTILGRKDRRWSYEQEYRLVTQEKYVSIKGCIRRVILGRSAPRSMEAILRRLMPAGAFLARVGLDPGARQLTVRNLA